MQATPSCSNQVLWYQVDEDENFYAEIFC